MASRPGTTGEPTPRATVLVIEQDPLDLWLQSCLLKQSGHRVFATLEVEVALLMLQTRPIDLVTIETARDRQDGISLCREIRELCPYLPMIIVSQRSDLEHVIDGLDTAADDYIRKPFASQVFLARVEALLRRVNSKPRVRVRPPDHDRRAGHLHVLG